MPGVQPKTQTTQNKKTKTKKKKPHINTYRVPSLLWIPGTWGSGWESRMNICIREQILTNSVVDTYGYLW